MKIRTLLISLVCFALNGLTQFAGPAGTVGSTAIHKDSSVFINWANAAQLNLGFMDIANPAGGTTSIGDANSPVGYPDGNVVSLGDSGVAILTFAQPITNGPGPDFAVFENGFSDNFLELAFVEVSSDGLNFYRFPAVSNTQTETQIGTYEALGEASLLNNLAGKYSANFGTPFDLQELDGIAGLDLSAVTHVKVIDAVGVINGNHAQLDSNGTPINDPYPTNFPAGGFDLDAVGVIHQGLVGLNENAGEGWSVFPNPVQSNGTITIAGNSNLEELRLISPTGVIVVVSESNSMELTDLPAGIYLLQIQTATSLSTQKVLIR